MSSLLEGRTILLVHAMFLKKKFVLEKFKELELKIVCVNQKIFDFAESFVDQWIFADLTKEDETIKAVEQFRKEHPEVQWEGVITFWDECIELTAKIAELYGLPGIPYEVAKTVKNKSLFREACRERSLPAPRQKLLHSLENIDTLEQSVSYPLIIKPVYGAASAFVVRADKKEELMKAYTNLQKNISTHYLAAEWKNFDVLVEEYIDGQEVDIDILIQKGEVKYLSITDNAQTHEPYFVETGWQGPSNLPDAAQKALADMATNTLVTLGVTEGCIHFEAKYSPTQGAVPIEVNMRMGGGEVYLYCKTIWGVDLVEEAVKIALGVPLHIDKPTQPLTHLISYRFLSDVSCTLVECEVDKELSKKPYLVSLYFEKKVGEKFLAPPEGYDRSLGVITVSGSNASEVEKNLAEARTYIHYRVEPLL